MTPAEVMALVAQLETDGGLLHQMVHGGSGDTVETAGGTVPSMAKFFADKAALIAAGLTATSTSEVTIGTGAKSFAIPAGKLFAAGQLVLAVDAADAGHWMFGSVTAYADATLTLAVTETMGAGTISSWLIAVCGTRGPQGDKGDTGDTGPKGDKGDTGDTGPQGDAGASFTVDATGTLAARSAHDAEAAGFSYLATDTGDLYIRETATAGVWSAAIPFGKGEKGDTGDVGPIGDTGPKGDKGDDGDSAYAVAVAGGFVGTQAEWLASLKGAKGDKGDTGAAGSSSWGLIDGTLSDQTDLQAALDGKQAASAQLAALALLTSTAFGRALLEVANAAALRSAAGLIIGTDVQGYDADLAAIAALTTTAYGRSLLTAADAAGLRTLGGLVIGTNVQAYHANLAALAGLVLAADKLPYSTGAGALALADLSAFARTLLDDANAATALATLGALAKDGSIAMTGALTLPADPTSALHAATKQYVDNLAAGLDVKASCRLATTANDTLSGLAARDGITPVAGDRVLVTAQTAPAQNGIYIAASGAWTRASDMDAWAEIPGSLVIVEQGTLYGDTGWICTADQGGTLGTTSIGWSRFFGTGLFQASHANLSALAGLTLAADKLLYATGAGAVAMADLTAFARTLLAGADAAAMRTTLGAMALAGGTFTGTVTTKGLRETVTAMAANDMDLSAGTIFTKTIAAAATLTFSNAAAGSEFTLYLTNGGAYTVTWPTGFRWPGGTAPTLTTSGTDVVSGISKDGTYFDVAILKDSK